MATTSIGSSGVTFPDSTTQTSGSQAAKAWVNFNNSGTILAGYNVSSITVSSANQYVINFTNALADANYIPVVGVRNTGGTGFGTASQTNRATTYSTTQYAIQTGDASGLATYANIYVAVFR